jgi:hypothetical protein
LLSNTRRITGDNRVCGYILGDDSTCPNHGVCAYCNSRNDCGIRSNASMLANLGGKIFDMPIRPRVKVVGEHYPMSNEDIIFKGNIGAQKGMAHNAAVCADDDTASYLDKRPNERTIPNATSVNVDLFGVIDFYILTKNYIGINHGIKGYK